MSHKSRNTTVTSWQKFGASQARFPHFLMCGYNRLHTCWFLINKLPPICGVLKRNQIIRSSNKNHCIFNDHVHCALKYCSLNIQLLFVVKYIPPQSQNSILYNRIHPTLIIDFTYTFVSIFRRVRLRFHSVLCCFAILILWERNCVDRDVINLPLHRGVWIMWT